MQTNLLSFSDKRSARASLLQLRGALSAEEYSDKLCDNIISLSEYADADTLLLYFPTGSEPDLTPLLKRAQADGKQVAFPISQTDTLTLDFRTVSSLFELREGAYGIREPLADAAAAAITERTLCIVPAIAVDAEGYRLGYGKGYYDRFLADFCGSSAVAIHSSLVCDRLPRNDTDAALKKIITQTGVFLSI